MASRSSSLFPFSLGFGNFFLDPFFDPFDFELKLDSRSSRSFSSNKDGFRFSFELKFGAKLLFPAPPRGGALCVEVKLLGSKNSPKRLWPPFKPSLGNGNFLRFELRLDGFEGFDRRS